MSPQCVTTSFNIRLETTTESNVSCFIIDGNQLKLIDIFLFFFGDYFSSIHSLYVLAFFVIIFSTRTLSLEQMSIDRMFFDWIIT